MVPGQIKQRIKFCTDKTIAEYIAPEHLPDYIKGGKCERKYRVVPKNCVTIEELAKIGKGLNMHTEEQANRVKKYYEKLFADLNAKQSPVIEPAAN